MKCSLQWTCMWVGRTVKSSVSQSSQSQPEEQTGRANLLSVQPRRRHIWANLFRALLFFFSVLTFLFFWWATPSHWLVAAFICFSFCIKGSSFSLYSERKREIFVVYLMEEMERPKTPNPWRQSCYPTQESSAQSQSSNSTHILCGLRHHVLRLHSWLFVTSLSLDAFPWWFKGGEKKSLDTRTQLQGFATQYCVVYVGCCIIGTRKN